MATNHELVAQAEHYIGITESPPDSNNVVFNTRYYNREISGSAYPWCCVFIWCLFQDCEGEELFYGGGKTASCTTLYNFYRQQGQSISPNQAQRGDLVFFNFDGNASVMNHIGICESCEDGYITTIDGNTGTSNEANGGAVMRRRRALSYVGGVARPAYDQEPEEPAPEPAPEEMPEMTVARAKVVMQEVVGLSEGTVNYLYLYRWGDELLIKLAKAVEREL